jgi:hypothetical protein
LIADVLKPKGFAGLFGAAPSVALATLALTIATLGKLYAATPLCQCELRHLPSNILEYR